MKKVLSGFMWAQIGMVSLYPLGKIIAFCIGYSFKLNYVTAFAVLLATLGLASIILDLIYKIELDNKVLKILLVLLPPVSLINSFIMLGLCSNGWTFLCLILVPICSCFFTVRHGGPFIVKSISLVISAVMLIVLVPSAFFGLLFGSLSSEEVVQSLESPNGEYYAEVIANNQGALGGSTIVKVYRDTKMGFILFEFKDIPQKVYVGEWGEFYDMEVSWKDSNCLLINSREYMVK